VKVDTTIPAHIAQHPPCSDCIYSPPFSLNNAFSSLPQGFATSLSIITSGILSYYFIPALKFQPTPTWFLGTALVLAGAASPRQKRM